MNSGFPLSVLDLVPVTEGGTATEAVAGSVALAELTDRLGYERYWVAEHHNMPGIASSSPALLISRLAAATGRIRVGSGGVMLPNHPPLVVAEQFGLLASMFPGRIDLGIGRAPGTDPRTAAALRREPAGLTEEAFPQHLAELIDYLAGEPVGPVHAVPTPEQAPPVWLLGSSGFSAQLAGMLGLPFAFAHHFSARNTLPALRLYRDMFRPSATLAEPYSMIAAFVICADTEEHARRIALPGALSFLKLRTGMPGRLPSVVQAADYPYSEVERAFVADRLADQIIGDPGQVRAGVTALLESTEVDELMVTMTVPDPADRLRSYELLAELFEPGPSRLMTRPAPAGHPA